MYSTRGMGTELRLASSSGLVSSAGSDGLSDPLVSDPFSPVMLGYEIDVWWKLLGWSVPQAYVIGSAPTAPPDQYTIDTSSPSDTINYILAQTQQNAVDAATAAASTEAAGSSPTVGGLTMADWLMIAAAVTVGFLALKGIAR